MDFSWEKLQQNVTKTLQTNKKIMFLVGAGLSAESGIPTFRGKEGFWKIGSKNYQPEEIGTYKMFCQNPYEVWKWFLFRKTICNESVPNSGHIALQQIEDLLGDQFALVSQNVDGLHKKAGNSTERTYLIHGDLDYVRCGDSCSDDLYRFPKLGTKKRLDPISSEEESKLKCPKCNDFLRPHVLWFDETYNEKYYSFRTVQNIADNTGLLFIIGTSGSTYLPSEIIDRVSFFDGTIVDINTNDNSFSEYLENYTNGYIIRNTSSVILPKIKDLIFNIIHQDKQKCN